MKTNKKAQNEDENLIYFKNQEPPIPGQKYTDPLFPPNERSLLGLNQYNKPIDNENYSENDNIFPSELEFKRPSEIFNGQKYDLFPGVIEMHDVIQGGLSDCYFLSSVANLCKFPELILNLFKTKKLNEDGFYEIIFYIDGIKQIVIVDDYIPVKRSTKWPCFSQPHENTIYVMLLEKAWAKINGGYVNVNKGLPSEALEVLTGMGSLSYDISNKDKEDLNEYKLEIVKNVQTADKNNCFISCSSKNDKSIEKIGLVPGHAYSVINFYEIETSNGENVYLFRLRNPWSKGEWSGKWSDRSPLWDEKTKNQVKFDDKEDGIFFMEVDDFFNYFTNIDICNILFDSKSITYTIEGEENLRNGIVFNVIIEKEGVLCVSIPNKNWRVHRELRYKIMPTHISIVKYDPNQKNKLKVFSDYKGTLESFNTCGININVTKGNYLIYVYRDIDHADYISDNILKVKIICSSEFKHAQMSYDERRKGFPLLQNIILQAEFEENKYDPDKGEDFNVVSNQIRGNGIGHVIYYISNPGYFFDFTGTTLNMKNYILMTPYLSKEQKNFHRCISSGKYLVFLGLMSGRTGMYTFNIFSKAFMTNRQCKEEYEDNDIDLKIYTDIKNDIKNKNLKESKRQSIAKTKTEFYFDVGDGKVIYSTLGDLRRQYGDLIDLLDDVIYKYDNTNLKWGVIKGEYVTYIGQVNEDGLKQGKGLLMNPKNIFAGGFYNDKQQGIGCTYNANREKLYYYNYIAGKRIGKAISPEEQKLYIQEEIKKQKELLDQEEKKREELLQRMYEEQKREEERVQKEIERIEREHDEELAKAEKFAKDLKQQIEIRVLKAIEKAEEKRKAEEESNQKIQLIREDLEKQISEIKNKQKEYNNLMSVKTMNIKREEEEAKQAKKKLIEQLNNFKKGEEEKKKEELEAQKKKEKLNDNLKKIGKMGLENYFEVEHSSKRRKEIDVPFEGEDSNGCVSCGCNIY